MSPVLGGFIGASVFPPSSSKGGLCAAFADCQTGGGFRFRSGLPPASQKPTLPKVATDFLIKQ
jgi:hypothetical protein